MTHQPCELTGLDGTTPLGFLAALGTARAVERRGHGEIRLGWRRRTTWIPLLDVPSCADQDALISAVVDALRGRPVPEEAEERLKSAQRDRDKARTDIKNKRKEIQGRHLDRARRRDAEERELGPLTEQYTRLHAAWLTALREATPRPELALGKRIEDASPEDFRDMVAALVSSNDPVDREALEMLAGFASDACLDGNGRLAATPFEFTTGASHQWFLDSVRQLVARVSSEGVREALFGPWRYRDKGLSMRWDPVDDRRYALLDRDPTASDNKPRTVWMANLLAYHALALFPVAPRGRELVAAGWSHTAAGLTFTWPIWDSLLPLDAVRSLLWLPDLVEERPDGSALRARGVAAVYRAQRIEVRESANRKLTFSPARALL